MERDFRKFAAWLEETLQVEVVEENKLWDWKLAEKSKLKKTEPESNEHAKAS